MAVVDESIDDRSVQRQRVLSPSEGTAVQDFLKRGLDLAVGIPMLLLALPVIVVTGVLIRLDSPGPIVFRQARVGIGGIPFTFYKFRTMFADAKERFPELYQYRYDHETVKTMRYKVIDDPRLTRIGRWLRKTSLDELPNLINVVTGDVALVGPRPEIPDLLPYYETWQLKKFSVKPGVTGFAQVNGRGLLTFQEVISEDLRYIETRSLFVDLRTLFETVIEVVRRQGAF